MSDSNQTIIDFRSEDSGQSPIEISGFIGRTEELAHFQQRLIEARAGQGGGLALRGESGIGKTRLAYAIAQWAAGQDMRVIFFPCRGMRFRPYRLIAELIQVLLRMDTTRSQEKQYLHLLEDLQGRGLPELTATFSELLDLSAPANPNAQTYARTGMLVSTVPVIDLPEALGRLIQSLSLEMPLLLIFDDLDMAHDATRSIVMNIAQELINYPALLLASFDTEAPARFQMAFGSSVVDLKEFPLEEYTPFCRFLLGDQTLADIEKLWELTGGHPFYTILALDELRRTGDLTAGEEGDLVLNEAATLPGLKELIGDRFRRLPTVQQQTLSYGAILDHGFRVGALGALFGQSYSDEVHVALNKLVENVWLERSGANRLATYRFVSRIVRRAIYEQIPAEERQRLHKRAGDYYAVPRSGGKMRIENALYHYLANRDIRRGLDLIEMAIEQARRHDNQDELQALYRRGAEVAAKDTDYHYQQAAYAELMGDVYAARGDYRGAAQSYSSLSPTTVPVSLLGKLGLSLLAVDSERALGVLEKAAPAVARDATNDLYWRIQSGLVLALAQTGRMYDAIRLSRDLLNTMGEAVGLGGARTLLRGTLGLAMFYYDDPLEAHTHLESARAGWGARGENEGIMLINQILIETPLEQITLEWLRFVLKPMLGKSG